MERNITVELVEVLDKKKADFMTFANLKKIMGVNLKKRLGLTDKSGSAQIEKALLPHLDEALMLKRGSKNSAYLTLKLHDEDLLFRVVQKNNWKIPRMDRVPFKKDEFFAILSQLLENDAIRVNKINKDYKVLLLAPAPTFQNVASEERGVAPKPTVTEEDFKVAFQALERGKFYVRICDLRRRLDWNVEDFNTMLIRLRDAGKIQLHTSSTDSFTKDDIRDSFIDDRGFSKFLIEWR